MIAARYPMGEERLLIRQVFGKGLARGAYPVDEGILVMNVQTVYQIYSLLTDQYHNGRFVTLADLDRGFARVEYVKRGENIEEKLKSCFPQDGDAVCFAGSGIMCAHIAENDECFSDSISFAAIGQSANISNDAACKGCGMCSRKCPAGVNVKKIVKRREKDKQADISDLGAENCIHCGSCTFFAEPGKTFRSISKRSKYRKELIFMERRGRNTKQKIMQESMKLFSISGFDTVSIRTIAEAVGVGNSALYKHFRSKKEILDEIVSYSVEYYLEMGKQQMMQIHGLEDLQKACLTMFDFQTKDEWMVMFRRLLVIEQFKDPEMAAIYRKFFIDLPLRSQGDLFRQLMIKGVMKDGNEKVLAMELYAPFYLYHLSSDSQQDLRELFKVHVKNFWEANFIGVDSVR